METTIEHCRECGCDLGPCEPLPAGEYWLCGDCAEERDDDEYLREVDHMWEDDCDD